MARPQAARVGHLHGDGTHKEKGTTRRPPLSLYGADVAETPAFPFSAQNFAAMVPMKVRGAPVRYLARLPPVPYEVLFVVGMVFR
ncbi:hypothetical protein FBZ92_10172 [Nitrospirillum viridazoti]|uniref:Uncharacterized protein n=1 Tax=Nitrospirillum amazonense TaxID=28077 RepID=A0A560J173_9PROT|nr:hypothetical protein FBZ92_10172 [Nitrospirillum amazonense]